jgi:hypothetical protein
VKEAGKTKDKNREIITEKSEEIMKNKTRNRSKTRKG